MTSPSPSPLSELTEQHLRDYAVSATELPPARTFTGIPVPTPYEVQLLLDFYDAHTAPLSAPAPVPALPTATAFADCQTISEVLFQVMGAASVCWESPAGAGEFDSAQASEFGNAALARIHEILKEDTTNA